MKRFFGIILALAVLASVPCAAKMTTVVVGQGVSGSAGGTLLVGSNSVGTDSTGFLPSGDVATGDQFTASASGNAAKGYVRVRAYSGSVACKFIIATSGGTITEVSPGVTGIGVTFTTVEFTLAGTTAISASTAYRLAVVCDGYYHITNDDAAWAASVAGSSNYADPGASLPGGSLNCGNARLWVVD